MNISVKFEEIELNIRDIQQSISRFRRVDLEPEDFYKRMIELTNDHPEAYDMIQAMLLLFSKMETSNKVFKEHVIDYSVNGLKLKQATIDIVQEHMRLIEELDESLNKCTSLANELQEEIKNCKKLPEVKEEPIPDGNFVQRFKSNFIKYTSDPKNFGKVLVGLVIPIVFVTILVLEAAQPKLLHSTLNSFTSVIKGEQIKERPETSKIGANINESSTKKN